MRARERTESLSLALPLSRFNPWGVVYRQRNSLRFANGFPRLGFVFLPICPLYRIFISRVKKQETGSCPKDPVDDGTNGYFVGTVGTVGGCICWFCDGFVIWLPWWLIDVSHIVFRIAYLLCFVFGFLRAFAERVPAQRVCVCVCLQGVNCAAVALTDLQ